uniref:Uncharacterized protein n=1 Tax=Lepeophtheirus salmonis TaxID=72036 RepID=A0A0K2UNU7_LEPSM
MNIDMEWDVAGDIHLVHILHKIRSTRT